MTYSTTLFYRQFSFFFFPVVAGVSFFRFPFHSTFNFNYSLLLRDFISFSFEFVPTQLNSFSVSSGFPFTASFCNRFSMQLVSWQNRSSSSLVKIIYHTGDGALLCTSDHIVRTYIHVRTYTPAHTYTRSNNNNNNNNNNKYPPTYIHTYLLTHLPASRYSGAGKQNVH